MVGVCASGRCEGAKQAREETSKERPVRKGTAKCHRTGKQAPSELISELPKDVRDADFLQIS